MLKRLQDVRVEIKMFCEKKGTDIPEFLDADWVADFEFAVDVIALMNELNAKLQCKDLFVHEMYSLVRSRTFRLLPLATPASPPGFHFHELFTSFPPQLAHPHSFALAHGPWILCTSPFATTRSHSTIDGRFWRRCCSRTASGAC